MKNTKEFRMGQKIITLMASVLIALVLLVFAEPFSIVSHAESQGKIVATSAKVRQEASTASVAVGSVVQGTMVTVNGETTADDGKIWYQVEAGNGIKGYIRSDLLEIVDGNENNTPDNDNMPGVTAVEPISANVKGSEAVRVRGNASTGSQIVCMAENGLALTVIGQTVGTDGKDWYQVKFISDNSEVIGFIRSDYIELSGELQPATGDATPEDTDISGDADMPMEDEEVIEQTPVVSKDWDTQYDEGKWYLVDYVGAGRYEIDNIFKTVENNVNEIAKEQATVKSQKVIIIVLVVVVIALAGVIVWLSLKFRDEADAAYYARVEKEQARKRANRQQGGSQKVMHTVGGEQRPGASRPTQSGQRPNGNSGQRPGQGSQRPSGAPAQGGQRPGGSAQRPGGPSAQRANGVPKQNEQKSGGVKNAVPVKKAEQGRPQPTENSKKKEQDQNWQSKNFMADDEFEYEFLNWDGVDEE